MTRYLDSIYIAKHSTRRWLLALYSLLRSSALSLVTCTLSSVRCFEAGVAFKPIITKIKSGWYRIGLLGFILLGGCAGLPSTVGDLYNSGLSLENKEHPPVSTAEVVEYYRHYLEVSNNPSLHPRSMKRLADILMFEGEQGVTSEHAVNIVRGEKALRASLVLYKDLQKRYPQQPGNDQVLYNQARIYDLLNQPKQAVHSLNRLTKTYGKSRYRVEAQFRLGEIYFVRRDYAHAEKAFNYIVKQASDSVYYEKALYKSGWAQFKQKKHQQALTQFSILLDRYHRAGKIDEVRLAPDISRSDKELLQDVIRVTNLCFSYLDGAKSVANLFRKMGRREYEPLIYSELAAYYLQKNRITDAAETLLTYVKGNHESDLAPKFHANAVVIYQQGNLHNLARETSIVFVNRFGVASKYWQSRTKEQQAIYKPLLEQYIKELAFYFHAAARKKPISKSDAKKQYETAAKWYQLYVDSFPKNKDSAYIYFVLGESRYEAGHYQRAINAYETSAYDYPEHENSAEAGYAAIVTYQALIPTLAKNKRDDGHKNSIKSALRFIDNFPKDKRVEPVMVRTADALFALRDYNKAAETAKDVLDRKSFKDKKLRHTAWTILGHARFELGQYQDAEKIYALLLDNTPKKDSQYSALLERYTASIYKQAEENREDRAYQKAAYLFLQVAEHTQDQTVKATAEYDAATMFIRMSDWNRAIVILESFRVSFSGNKKYSRGVNEKLALSYQNTGQGAKAAKEMLVLASSYGDKTFRREMMLTAAQMYDQDNLPARAAKQYKQYIKQYPVPLTQAVEARYYLAQYYQEQEQLKSAQYWYKDIIKAHKRYKKYQSPRSHYLAALASLKLALTVKQKYDLADLKGSLKRDLARKKKLMKQTIRAYEQALDYNVAGIQTLANYHLGEIFNEFARTLLGAKRPKGMDDEVYEQYVLLMEEQAYPFEEKAIEIHTANALRTKYGVYDEGVKKSFVALKKLLPVRYSKDEKLFSYVLPEK